MFLDITVRTQPIALPTVSGSTRHPPHRNRQEHEGSSCEFALNPSTSLAIVLRGRRLSTGSISSWKVSWPKVPSRKPKHDGKKWSLLSSTTSIRPAISGVFVAHVVLMICDSSSSALKVADFNGRRRFAATSQSRALSRCVSYWCRRDASKINDAEMLSSPLLARCVAAVELIDCDAACDSMRIEGSSGPALKTTQARIIFLGPRSCPCPASLLVATKRGNLKWRMIIAVDTFAPSNSLEKFRRVAAAQAVTLNFYDSLLSKVLKRNEGRNVWATLLHLRTMP
jgi:hypothetical protein